MPLHCHVESDVLVVRSVGDQPVEEGLAQLNHGISLAQGVCEETGRTVDFFMDLIESDEAKGPEEIKQIIVYLASCCPPLSGRIAVAAPGDVLFGLSNVFSARASVAGITAEVFRTPEEAWGWLRP